MTTAELTTLIKQAQSGDVAAYEKLYQAVYRPLYKIARTALKSEAHAIEAIKLTVSDSFVALPSAKLSNNGAFIEWIVTILCTKIRHLFKTVENKESTPDKNKPFDMRSALDSLPDIERLVIAVSTVCSCSTEKTAKLCGYTEETVGVCLTNAEVTLKTLMLSDMT